jgi:hypothetical protein
VKFETIMVAVGREFTVRLKSDSRTGHFWRVYPLVPGVEFLGSCLEKKRDSVSRGEKVIQVFRLCATAAGEYTIRFVLDAQGEGDPTQAYTVAVIASLAN